MALLATAVALSGCGASDRVDPAAVAKAADRTAAAGQAWVTMTFRVHGTMFRAAGVIDLGDQRFAVTSRDSSGRMAEMRSIGRTLYFQSADGRRWEKVDLVKAFRRKGIDASSLEGTVLGGDPIATIEQLRVAGAIRKLGRETVRGVATTHYRASVDLRKVAERVPPAKRAAARRSIERYIAATGYETIPVEAWIDEQGRLRREVSGRQRSSTIELYGFGPHGEIVAPPARETVDVTRRAGVTLVG